MSTQLSLTLCLCPVLVWLPHRNGAFLTLLLFLQSAFFYRTSSVYVFPRLVVPRFTPPYQRPLFLFIGFCGATFKSRWRKMSFNSISQLKRLFQGGHHPKNCRHDLLFMQSCQAKAFRQSRGIFKGCTISAWFPLSVRGVVREWRVALVAPAPPHANLIPISPDPSKSIKLTLTIAVMSKH